MVQGVGGVVTSVCIFNTYVSRRFLWYSLLVRVCAIRNVEETGALE